MAYVDDGVAEVTPDENRVAEEFARAMAAEYERGRQDALSFVNDLLTVWHGYSEGQCGVAHGNRRLVLADRAQSFQDVRFALEHPKTITWPIGHPRRPVVAVKPPAPAAKCTCEVNGTFCVAHPSGYLALGDGTGKP